MSKMPFFKMYPADAETDANFRLMDDAELGFYWRCLNHCWINGGLPADPEDRARMLRTPREMADRYWIRVGRCFVETLDGRVVNPRQERERAEAQASSDRAREKAAKRWYGNIPNDAAASAQHMPKDDSASPRASDFCLLSSDGSSSVSSSTNTSTEPITVRRAREIQPCLGMTWATDEQYQVFAVNARAFWQDLIDEDLQHWYPDWKRLPVADQLLVNVRLKERIAGGQDFHKVFKPTYFTRGEWKREHIPVNVPIPFPVRETATERAIRIGHERFQKYGRL